MYIVTDKDYPVKYLVRGKTCVAILPRGLIHFIGYHLDMWNDTLIGMNIEMFFKKRGFRTKYYAVYISTYLYKQLNRDYDKNRVVRISKIMNRHKVNNILNPFVFIDCLKCNEVSKFGTVINTIRRLNFLSYECNMCAGLSLV